MTVVLGKPIAVPRIEHPDHETVDKYLNTFIDAMSALVEEHKAKAGACHTSLLRSACPLPSGCVFVNEMATGMPDACHTCLSCRIRGHAADHQVMLQFGTVSTSSSRSSREAPRVLAILPQDKESNCK